ncbi:MAG: outer membrane protein assembly factor BamE [Bdellovibrionales bacterium]|nr:outer membrane protein assembly factor BamE [Bdellovibrionales bacterium]
MGKYLLILLVLAGCQTHLNRKESFAQIETQMHKSDVLSIIGDPDFTDRKDSVDRWHYYMIPNQRGERMEVHFRKGKVIYKGEAIPPQLTPEEAESINKPQLKPYERTVSDEELEKIIKEDLRKERKGKKPSTYEDI